LADIFILLGLVSKEKCFVLLAAMSVRYPIWHSTGAHRKKKSESTGIPEKKCAHTDTH
jgi:hypothetical protein